MTFSKLINNRIIELKNSNLIKVQSFYVAKAKSKQSVNKIFKKNNFPNQLKNFYYQCDGFFLNYYYHTEKNSILNSQISFLDGLSMNGQHLSLKLNLDDFLVFETLSFGNCVILKEDDNNEVSLYLYTFNKHLNKINLSFSDYIEKSIQYLGIELWQQFFIDNPLNISTYYLFNPDFIWLTKKLNISFPKLQWDLALKKSKNNTINVEKYLNSKISSIKNIDYTFSIEKPNSILEIIKAQEDFEYNFSDFVIDFFSQISYLNLEWNLIDKSEIGGFIWIKSIGNILGGNEFHRELNWNINDIHKNEIGYYAQDGNEIKEYPFIRRLKILESFIGNSGLAGFTIQNNKMQMYVRLLNEMVEPIMLTLEEYLKLNLSLLGESNWRILLKEECKDCKESIQKVFPEFDFSEIRR